MTALEELIQYWKKRLSSTPLHTTLRHFEAIRDTITYLEKLNELWKEK